MVCGICWLTFLFPLSGFRVFTFAAVGLLSMEVTILWLLIRGVYEDKMALANCRCV